MRRRIIGLLVAGVLIGLFGASGALAGVSSVKIRVVGQHATLLPLRTVRTTSSVFSKDGNPADTCSGTSAGGALQQATHGNWAGTYSKSLGYFVTTILGETHPGSPDYWAFWVNHRQASAGICSTEMRPDDDVLFFVDSCTFDAATQGCSNKPVLPLGLSVPKKAKLGHRITVRVVIYTPSGKSTSEPGASVYVGNKRLGKTNARGRLQVLAGKRGKLTLTAKKSGTVVSEPDTVRVS